MMIKRFDRLDIARAQGGVSRAVDDCRSGAQVDDLRRHHYDGYTVQSTDKNL